MVETVGAGDAFTAALIMGILAEWPVDAIYDAANRIAAHVCGCVGGTPPLSEALRELFRSEPVRAVVWRPCILFGETTPLFRL